MSYKLNEYIKKEVYNEEAILKNWYKIFSPIRTFLFFFRLSYVLLRKKNKCLKLIGFLLNKRLNVKYGMDIDYRAEIDLGFLPFHLPGIIIRPNVIIGKNFRIHQNCTLGLKKIDDKVMIIGDNVTLGANVVVIGGINIGNNVYIGASTFINKDIKNNTVIYNEKKYVERVIE